MKKAVNRRINWILIQVANVAAIHNDRLKEFYERCKKRRRGKHVIAITHVANKTLRIIWVILILRESYKSHNVHKYDRRIKKMDSIRQSMYDVE